MGEVSTIGLDIAKAVFQVHGVDEAGIVLIRKRISRTKMLEFFTELPRCLVGIEACPSAHHWGRELQALGHTVKLMPPSYVKAYLKRGKNDANDAAAICEAVTRPSMRFVPIKTKEQQTALMLHRTRQLLVRQRTMLSNALRGHLAELGVVSAKGRNGTGELLGIIADSADKRVPPAIRGILDVVARQYSAIGTEIASIDKSILTLHRSCEASRRLAEIQASAQSLPPLWLPRSATGRHSHRGAVLLPGSGWCRSSIRPVARTGSAASPSRAIGTCDGC
jgi:transposase